MVLSNDHVHFGGLSGRDIPSIDLFLSLLNSAVIVLSEIQEDGNLQLIYEYMGIKKSLHKIEVQ